MHCGAMLLLKEREYTSNKVDIRAYRIIIPTSYFLLPTSYFLLPTSYFLLRTQCAVFPRNQIFLSADRHIPQSMFVAQIIESIEGFELEGGEFD